MDIEQVIRDTVRSVLRDELRLGLADLRPSPGSDYLTLEEAAEVAHVNYETMRRWVSTGAIVRQHAGRRPRVRRADLDRFMAGSRVDALSPEAVAASIAAKRRK
jgi:excisionase family DNA binding protein